MLNLNYVVFETTLIVILAQDNDNNRLVQCNAMKTYTDFTFSRGPFNIFRTLSRLPTVT